jgi:hypothetical protein
MGNIEALEMVAVLANSAREQLLKGEKPCISNLNRIIHLAVTVEREFDEQWQAEGEKNENCS